MEELLVYLAVIYHGDYRKINQAISRNERYDAYLINQCLSQLKCRYTTILSEDYPPMLRLIKDPPFVLFYYGDLSLVKLPGLSLIGMRTPDDYGKQIAKLITKALSDDFVIISGLAKGIDGICHQYARKTIAVLGCGIDYCYPACHRKLYESIKKDGLVLSEYPGKTLPQKYYFPFRNRIVAGLGWGVIVIQAKEKSGTMITVGHALEQGKPVFAVPCRIGDYDGTLALLKDGAVLLRNVKDIYEELNFPELGKND